VFGAAPALRIGRPRSPGSAGPSRRCIARQASIVLRQAREAFGGWSILGAEQFLPRPGLVAGLERIAECASDCEGRHRTEADQHLAREARDTRPLGLGAEGPAARRARWRL
jgi:hypothetical protein